MIAAYREFKNHMADTSELDEHLEHCPACRQVLARYQSLGEQIRSMPAIEPPPDMHAKLMQALAVEHIQFLQHAPSSATPPPDFLKPYLQEHMQHAGANDPLVAFSTAETGPLPIIHAPRPRSRRSQMGQFAVLGIAALFLITLMMGGITSLLLLGHGNPTSITSSSLQQPTNIIRVAYTTATRYQHVVSAVADNQNIYYTAYSDSESNGWMLEQLDRTTKLSTPLLSTPSTSPLIVLGSENGLLVWLQYDVPTASNFKNPLKPGEKMLARAWSLHYMPVETAQQLLQFGPAQPVTLATGTFNQDTAPTWVHTPIQGIWFMQNSLLVAMVDNNGDSHLTRYQIGTANKAVPVEIAKATSGRILTSPTATGDGSQIYWAEEWQTDDGTLHSDVWTQQVLEAPQASHGQWIPHTITVTRAFSANGMTFRPQVVDNTLFLLSTANISDIVSSATPGATPTSTATAAPTSTPIPNTTVISWADQAIYASQIDASIRGTLLDYALDSPSTTQPTIIATHGLASDLQAGTRFLLWQSDKGYEMYDAVENSPVTVGSALDSAQFLAVNGNTAVWTIAATTTPGASSLATLDVFNWPR
jgi:hypothetical protein